MQLYSNFSNEGKGLNIWDVYTLNTSNVLDGSNGQRACNSYYFYEKDVEALKSLGVTRSRYALVLLRNSPSCSLGVALSIFDFVGAHSAQRSWPGEPEGRRLLQTFDSRPQSGQHRADGTQYSQVIRIVFFKSFTCKQNDR